VVKQVSCGESHTAFISQTGKVFTIGSGEHGALGHGNKTTLTTPKIVSALAKLTCLQVSCGPYHTAFIAGEESEIGFVRVPPSAAPVNVYEEWEGSPDGRFDRAQDGSLLCARLFMCGIGKTGQLGLGDKSDMIKSPREVKWFTDNGHRVAKVSCGMHHTAVIAVPVHAMRMFITTVFTFGWGEHGRLGHGTENSCKIPTEVAFPEPFHAIDISAGEQHTLATSGRDNGCYAWGNNSFGQCAAGSPSSAEFSLTPNRVPIPEGIRVMSVTAGGRHRYYCLYLSCGTIN
jgi:alpha-tubulin suppressor-like RCC1 family protein